MAGEKTGVARKGAVPNGAVLFQTSVSTVEGMINIWGVCEFGEISHDPLRKWDCGCTFFCPCPVKRVEDTGKCCANCVYWLAADEKVGSEQTQGKNTL